MKRNTILNVLLLFVMAVVIIYPAAAQTDEADTGTSDVFVIADEADEAPIEGVVDSADGNVTLNNPDNSWMMGLLTIVLGIAIPTILLVAAFVTVTSVGALRDSVTPAAMREVLQPLYVTASQRLQDFQDSARSTPDPLDDVVASLLTLPFELIVTEMGKHGYIVRKADDDTGQIEDADVLQGLEPLPQG